MIFFGAWFAPRSTLADQRSDDTNLRKQGGITGGEEDVQARGKYCDSLAANLKRSFMRCRVDAVRAARCNGPRRRGKLAREFRCRASTLPGRATSSRDRDHSGR